MQPISSTLRHSFPHYPAQNIPNQPHRHPHSPYSLHSHPSFRCHSLPLPLRTQMSNNSF